MKFTEDEQSLLDRIAPMLDAVDLQKELSPDAASTIAIAELSGKKLNDMTRKLVVLLHQKKITTDEHRRWVDCYVARELKKGQN